MYILQSQFALLLHSEIKYKKKNLSVIPIGSSFYFSLSEINIGKQKIYSFKDNYAFSSPERDKWIEVCYDVVVIQVRQIRICILGGMDYKSV